jgi:hypothetical protein
MKSCASWAVAAVAALAVLSPSFARAASVTYVFGGSLTSTTLNFLSMAPAPSAGTPRAYTLTLTFDDFGIFSGGIMKVGSTTIDNFGAASGWSVNDAGANDILAVTGQSGVNATKFYQFNLTGGNVTGAATNSLAALNALLPTAAPSNIAIGSIGSGSLGYGGSIAVVPEPASIALLSMAGFALRRTRVHRR